jgi:hypothetical protein
MFILKLVVSLLNIKYGVCAFYSLKLPPMALYFFLKDIMTGVATTKLPFFPVPNAMKKNGAIKTATTQYCRVKL